MSLPVGIDREKLLEVALAMVHLNVHGDKRETRAWKNINWDVLDALREKGWISDPHTPAKSVAIRWRKRKGIATVRLPDHFVAEAELHWYEATGIGRREIRIKRLLLERS